MSRDLDNKDTLNQQLKGKISDLEDRFEETRQEYNNCLISRESIEQQKMDLERELTVANFFKYFQQKKTSVLLLLTLLQCLLIWIYISKHFCPIFN